MTASIKTSDAGFSVDQEPCPSVDWKDIKEIVAFKRDLWTRDLICLGFIRHDKTQIEVDEEMNHVRQKT